MQKDTQAQSQYKKDLKLTEEKNRAKYQQEIDANMEKIRHLAEELSNISILMPDDIKHLDDIIYLMESGRADNIKEALNECDKRDAEHNKQAMDEFYRRQDEIVRKHQERQEAERYFNQMLERQKMQRSIDKQNDELEKIRRELERKK